MSLIEVVLRCAAAGLRVFPVNARAAPLTRHGFKDATTEWPHCGFGWAVPADIVVVDLDVKNGKIGLRDFQDRAGCDPHDVLTPQATTPSGGLHLIYAASKAYKNAVAIDRTGIDTRAAGGYIVLPTPDSSRTWLRPLIGDDGVRVPLAEAPAWLDVAVRKEPSTRPPLVLAPRAALIPPASDSDSYAQKSARAQLERACAKIVAAPEGAQDATRHAQCFYVGGLIARGDLDYGQAYAALLEAALAMPAYADPWRNLETRVVRSLESGMAAPLPLTETESWVRNFRARMRLMRPGARHG